MVPCEPASETRARAAAKEQGAARRGTAGVRTRAGEAATEATRPSVSQAPPHYTTMAAADAAPPAPPLRYTTYESEAQLASITALIEKALSEPYSVFTYRYTPLTDLAG